VTSAAETTQIRRLRVAGGFGSPLEGPALVTTDGFSARYDLNPATGVITRRSHPLYGESVVGRILVTAFAKGGVATSWRLLDLVDRGTAPAALVFGVVNPVMVQAAVFAGLPIVHGVPNDVLKTMRTGDRLRLLPDERQIEVISR
jgi:predicted aconitase with swiveling domain